MNGLGGASCAGIIGLASATPVTLAHGFTPPCRTHNRVKGVAGWSITPQRPFPYLDEDIMKSFRSKKSYGRSHSLDQTK